MRSGDESCISRRVDPAFIPIPDSEFDLHCLVVFVNDNAVCWGYSPPKA